MAAAVNEHGAMARVNQRWNLIAPVTTMAEATMQQDHGRAGPVCRVPDSSTVVVHVALIACDRQGHGAMGFETLKVIVVRFHISCIRRSGRLKCDNDFQAFYKTAQKTSEITKSWGTGRSRPPLTGAGVG